MIYNIILVFYCFFFFKKKFDLKPRFCISAGDQVPKLSNIIFWCLNPLIIKLQKNKKENKKKCSFASYVGCHGHAV